MRWGLFFALMAAFIAWLLIVCRKAPFLDDLDELDDEEMDNVKGPR